MPTRRLRLSLVRSPLVLLLTGLTLAVSHGRAVAQDLDQMLVPDAGIGLAMINGESRQNSFGTSGEWMSGSKLYLGIGGGWNIDLASIGNGATFGVSPNLYAVVDPSSSETDVPEAPGFGTGQLDIPAGPHIVTLNVPLYATVKFWLGTGRDPSARISLRCRFGAGVTWSQYLGLSTGVWMPSAMAEAGIVGIGTPLTFRFTASPRLTEVTQDLRTRQYSLDLYFTLGRSDGQPRPN